MAKQQPDWDSLAEKFDLWLPHIAPVADAIINVLPVKPGDEVLDVASGTGEPALTLAQQNPHARFIGIDAAEGMVRAASKKPAAARLNNLEFHTMPAEAISYADDRFDAVVCRFGVMLFEDPQKGLIEMRRVLKPGGYIALTVWSTIDQLPTFRWSYDAFKGRIPEDKEPAVDKVTSLALPGVMEGMLETAGFSDIAIERINFNYSFTSFEEYWNLIENSDIMKMQFEALPEKERADVRDEVARFARDFQGPNGLVVPHQFLLVHGRNR